MSKTKTEFIEGICQQLLFNPKGSIEGALVKVKDAVIQITVPSHHGAALAHTTGPGISLRVLAVLDHSPKTAEGVHAVYRFESFADEAGKAVAVSDADPDNTEIKGVVAALNFTRHGQPNGVILKTGEFIHLRPNGMAKSGLEIGSKVHAVGEVHMTVMGTRLLEASKINQITLAA